QRLLPVLLQAGHSVVCCVRDRQRFSVQKYASENISVIELDFLDEESLLRIPEDIAAAYYLVHSMATEHGNFSELEQRSAVNFKQRIEATNARQVIYLSGIVNEQRLSKHLASRKAVEDILSSATFKLTTLKAGIIVGSGSASFEIIRDLVEKLPVMIAPRWLETRSQPIAVRNVIDYLHGVLLQEETFGQSFDIGGPDVITYKQMLLKFAAVRGLRRSIFIVPVMTPRLSSYWLYFVTATSYTLAKHLVNSMKVDVTCKDNRIHEMLGVSLLRYEEAIAMAFDKIEQQQVVSSWKDALTSDVLNQGLSHLVEVPVHGCFQDKQMVKVSNPETCLGKIWAIGGETGWYYANWLWEVRGFLDKMVGGVGLRRGRKNPTAIGAGEVLDFWRVLFASREEKRLLLYAEMRLPGEAWLEFKVDDENRLHQTATFRPLGLLGRLYWYAVLPFHGFIFRGMIKKIAAA
ncbi:MAG: SDR family oxidoreductase, partial [Cyclobacteriaceae bacterium]|nr:SDR family oxidoreductase [Cyclobacteriaceae bacterium]